MRVGPKDLPWGSYIGESPEKGTGPALGRSGGEMSREEQTAGAEVLGQDKTGGLVFS